MNESIKDNIKQLINKHDILVFAKGNKNFPMCGFSGQVIHILNVYNCDYHVVNVLDDADLREGIKVYADWPTIPQLYVKKKFIGGCDIICSLHEKNELHNILECLPLEIT
jgi:monothiol glutaredoxin